MGRALQRRGPTFRSGRPGTSRAVTDEARRSTNLALLERFRARQDGSQLSTAQVTEALDQARDERQALLSDAEGDAR